ncbi:MAG: hypothetical protein HOP08_14425 [Cyclobacteriaceae bacterium]|nr:hypothetical protein [Cyclobacteriaceae bacterium]
MKKIYSIVAIVVAGMFILANTNKSALLRDGFENGTPEIKSISALAFGPDGILFIGDSKSAAVFAIDTKDNQKVDKATAVDFKKMDQKIAAALGAEVQNITITDLVVNPVSKKVYCSVFLSDGTPALLRIDGDAIAAVNLKDVSFTSVPLVNAPAEDAKDQRGRPLRGTTISDMGFYDGKVMVSGLSNQEFSSSFRVIPFPFTKQQDQSSLEIYHAAHGKYENAAPIKTFTVSEINGKKFLIASYTCTPLVLFPLEDLKAGMHVKGRTVAEMGSGNSPLDMITMKKGGESFLIMANSSRPVFKVKYKSIEGYQESLTKPVTENFATAGVDFVSLPVVGVLQLEKLDDSQFLILQRKANGDLDLWTAGDRYL